MIKVKKKTATKFLMTKKCVIDQIIFFSHSLIIKCLHLIKFEYFEMSVDKCIVKFEMKINIIGNCVAVFIKNSKWQHSV